MAAFFDRALVRTEKSRISKKHYAGSGIGFAWPKENLILLRDTKLRDGLSIFWGLS